MEMGQGNPLISLLDSYAAKLDEHKVAPNWDSDISCGFIYIFCSHERGIFSR